MSFTNNAGRARHSVRAAAGNPTLSAGRGLPALPILPSLFVKGIVPHQGVFSKSVFGAPRCAQGQPQRVNRSESIAANRVRRLVSDTAALQTHFQNTPKQSGAHSVSFSYFGGACRKRI